MDLNEGQIERYSRQMILKDFGGIGQEKLLKSRVLVFGAGGLGSSLLMHLAGAGIGKIGIVDFDTVDISNLPRQIIHNSEDIGILKVDSVKNKIVKINPEIQVITFPVKATNENVEEMIFDFDLVVDCLDNFNDKFLINDSCIKLGKIFIHAGVVGYEGQVLSVKPSDTVTLRDIFPSGISDEEYRSCKEIGVLNTAVGIISTIQANEVLKIILGIGEPLYNRVLKFDAKKTSFKELNLNKFLDI